MGVCQVVIDSLGDGIERGMLLRCMENEQLDSPWQFRIDSQRVDRIEVGYQERGSFKHACFRIGTLCGYYYEPQLNLTKI